MSLGQKENIAEGGGGDGVGGLQEEFLREGVDELKDDERQGGGQKETEGEKDAAGMLGKRASWPPARAGKGKFRPRYGCGPCP